MQRSIVELAEHLGDPDDGSLRRAFAVWLDRVLLLDRGDDEEIPETLGLQEFRAMLENRVREWNRELREEAQAELLLRQLERRFGSLDPSTRARVARAGSERLLEWGERFATAATLADVFGE